MDNILFHYNLCLLIFASFCLVLVTLISHTSLTDFLFSQTALMIPKNSFPLHFWIVTILSCLLVQVSIFWCLSPSTAIDEQYFISCHLDLLCLSTPALSIQFKRHSNHNLLWFLSLSLFFTFFTFIYLFIFGNGIECFLFDNFLSLLKLLVNNTIQYYLLIIDHLAPAQICTASLNTCAIHSLCFLIIRIKRAAYLNGNAWSLVSK